MSRFGALVPCSLITFAVACNDAGPPPVAPATMAAAPVTTVVIDAGPTTGASPTPTPVTAGSGAGAGGDGGVDFYACAADSDCTAVAKVGCCQNGFLEGVNKKFADAYRASFVCEKKRPICPMYRIVDKRQPICGTTSHRCELLQPDQITCNGSGPDVHACANGSQCDSGGHCTPTP